MSPTCHVQGPNQEKIMRDIFGIGIAIQTCVEIYFTASRRTGRTSLMIDCLQNGDRVIFHDPNERDRVCRLIHERHLNVDCVCIPVTGDAGHRVRQLRKSAGKTLFDHTWIEKFHLNDLRDSQKRLHDVSRALSATGAHRETAETRMQASKWRR